MSTTVSSIKPSRAIRLLLMVLFVIITSNVTNAQTASSTWALTDNGNPGNVGNVTGTAIAFGSGLKSPDYGNVGVNTGSWSKDANNLKNDEYYEFKVTPNPNTVFNVAAINFEHSASKGNWKVQAFYSTDNFATWTPISSVFNSGSTSPTANNNTVNISVENATLTVRIFGWESDGNNQLRIRNVVINGTTCTKPSSAGTISGTKTVCQGENSVTYSVPVITTATGYTWTLPTGATIVSGANTRTITVNYSSSAISGNITVQGTNSCGSGAVSSGFAVVVNSSPLAPSIGTITQPTCLTATGSVVISGLPGSGTWILTRSPGDVTTTGTGTSTSISGLSPGTFTYSVEKANNATGLKGEYFNNIYFSGNPILTRTDATVNFDWGGGSPDSSINDNGFSVRWSGQIQPIYSETYTFSTSSDDGIRLWVNGIQIINNWTNHGATTDTGNITLIAGVKYSLVLEYYENSGNAVSKLSWNSPSQSLQIIPKSQLYAGTSCSSPYSTNVVINNQPLTPSAPTVATPTQPDCKTPTGSLVLSGLPASGTIYQKTGTTVTNFPITASPMTISGLAAGTYNFTVTNASGCTSTASADVLINAFVAVTNTWTTNWSNGTPNSNQKLVFTGNYPPAIDPNVDLNGCSCKVAGNAEVTIKSGRTLTITNEVDVQSNAVLTFENNATLLQENNTPNINSGDIEYQRATNSVVRKTDYVYWSSPVVDQDLKDLSSKTVNGTFYSFDTVTEDWKQEFAGKKMDIGKGYIVRRPDFISGIPVKTETYTAYFVGVPNNGTMTVPSGFNGSATGTSILIGNPYPSAIDADKFLADINNKNVLDGTLYFWTNNTEIGTGTTNLGSGAFAYTSNDYASYNRVGGTAAAPSASTGGANKNKPSGKIAAGQGFFATSKAAGNVTFTNAMRVSGASNNNSQFFKTKNPNGKTTNAIEKNRVWLNLTNTQGAFKQTLIGYVTDATNEYDNLFDGESFDGQEFVDFYSVNQDKNLVIQGRALPFDETDEVPLGFRTTINGAFTINIDQVDGLLTNQAVFIEDKLTNTVTDLKSGNYTFNTEAGTFNDRFVLKFTNKTLGTNNFDSLENKVLVSNANKQIKINSFAETIDTVLIYDLLGRQIYQKNKVNSNELSIANLIASHQVLLVKTVLQNGKTFTDKIIF